MNSSAKGNSAERFVAADLKAKGYVVASRRHIGGAGDLLAVHPNGTVWLVEVKARKNLYAGFTRADREAMKLTTLPSGSCKWVANVKGSGKNRTIDWISELQWP